MFQVEIQIRGGDRLTAEMKMMRAWLAHQGYEPTTFRYIFGSPGVIFRVDFTDEAPAAAFASAFGGKVIAFSSVR
jgi:hypothetical protein